MQPAEYRILDANANRAREGLRVVEDYARFVLDDGVLSAELKLLRHGLSSALAPFLPDALLHRDTPGDVGTGNKTSQELTRHGLADVVAAAGKRLGEALRVLEEVLKTADPAAAGQVEAIRYQFYEIERRVGASLRPAGRFAKVRLYVLVTESLCRIPWLEASRQAIAGGADCLQLREKSLESGELLRRARAMVALCRAHGALSIINDRPDIAVLAGADGVHVGQQDLPLPEARKIVGAAGIVGVSTHQIEQARAALRDGADYIGVGPVFRSSTKPREILPGLAYAREAAKLRIPTVAIAGITAENLPQVIASGVQAVAVTAGVMGQENVEEAARAMRRQMEVAAGN